MCIKSRQAYNSTQLLTLAKVTPVLLSVQQCGSRELRNAYLSMARPARCTVMKWDMGKKRVRSLLCFMQDGGVACLCLYSESSHTLDESPIPFELDFTQLVAFDCDPYLTGIRRTVTRVHG